MSLNPDEANLRLKEVIKSIKATYDDIEEETGISRNTWIRLTKPGNSIKVEHIYLLGDKYDIDINYILTGKRSVPTWGESVPTSADFGTVPTWAREESEQYNFDPAEFASVPYYPNVYASGGQGLIAENERSINMVFRSYFFNKTIQAAPANCFMIKIKGDSMSPMYNDGSDLLVDTARTKIKEGPGFIVRIEDVIYCKLLSKLPGGKVRLSSINSNYAPFEGDPTEDDFEIIGEVVWDASLSKYIY